MEQKTEEKREYAVSEESVRKPERKTTVLLIASVIVVAVILAVLLIAGAKRSKEEQQLREKYPEYFDLDTTYGLELYVWQWGNDRYVCGLAAGVDQSLSEDKLASEIELTSATLAIGAEKNISLTEMKKFVDTYKVSKEEVRLHLSMHPLSSFLDPELLYHPEECQAKVEELFWKGK